MRILETRAEKAVAVAVILAAAFAIWELIR
jgi:hypothetical protein